MAKRRKNKRKENVEFDVVCFADIDIDNLFAEIDADNKRIAAAPHYAELRTAVLREFPDADAQKVFVIVERWQIAMQLAGISLETAVSCILRSYSSPPGRRGMQRLLGRSGKAINHFMMR